ncbi:MAG: LysR family transcriptional regulator [Burkholderiaceae bacterium]
MDKHHLISVFVAVVDANGFAGAARKLKVSPPVVTRAINELEETLGVRLLMRTTRVVRVTEAGARYADDCRRILAELAEADESASGQHGEPHGQIAITAPGWFGAKFITPIVTEYLNQHPKVSATCWFLDRLVNMVEEGVDVAVRIAELPDSSLQAISVGRMRVVTCASPAYLARQGLPRTLADLASHNIVCAGAVAPGHELRFSQDGRSRVLKMQPRLATTTNESAVAAAVSDFGLTQQMLYKVAEPLARGQLQEVLCDFEPPALPVHVLHREGRYASRRVRAFLDLAIERLRALPELQA